MGLMELVIVLLCLLMGFMGLVMVLIYLLRRLDEVSNGVHRIINRVDGVSFV